LNLGRFLKVKEKGERKKEKQKHIRKEKTHF
jgi:hypothetical protein